MTGVSSTLHSPKTTAYCLATEGGEDGGPCTFFREESGEVDWETVCAEAKQHRFENPGHEVWVDHLARTVYAPEPAAVIA